MRAGPKGLAITTFGYESNLDQLLQCHASLVATLHTFVKDHSGKNWEKND